MALFSSGGSDHDKIDSTQYTHAGHRDFAAVGAAPGGAGAAYPQDSLASATNPAGMVDVGDRLDAGGALFSPNRQYSSTNVGTIQTPSQESSENQFLIPHFGYNKALGTDQSIGLAIYGNGGMNTTYDQPVFTPGATETGVNLAQLFINVAYARDFGSVQFGVSGIVVYQVFEAKGLGVFDNIFFSESPGKVTDNGEATSTGLGVRLGVSGNIAESFTWGVSYQPAIDMSEFDEYAGLFAEKGDFDIPSNYVIGGAWQGGGIVVAFDYMAINYSDVAAVNNPGPQAAPPFSANNLLGASNGFGFGWEDITVIKIGVGYTLNENWILRGGLNKGENPIPASETLFNILAPGVIEDTVTLGFTWLLDAESEFNFAFMHAFEGETTGPVAAALGGGSNTLSMDQNEIELSYGVKL